MAVAEQEQSRMYSRAVGAPVAAGGYAVAKSAVEWLAALVLLVAAAPLIAVLGVMLRCTSRGPALYSQVRLGRFGRPFRLYKLRTMVDRCEEFTGPVWSTVDDPRATRLGRWLRATHLDELPQLWNIVRGEMSLIGPRPERPEIAEQIERVLPSFRSRLAVRPGLTGLAQVLLPPDADINTVRFKLAHDLEYIRRIGVRVDARVALSTALILFGVSGAAARRLLSSFAAYEPIEAPVTATPPLRLAADSFRLPVPAAAPVASALSKAA